MLLEVLQLLQHLQLLVLVLVLLMVLRLPQLFKREEGLQRLGLRLLLRLLGLG